MDLEQFTGLKYLETPHNQFYNAVVEKIGLDAVMCHVPFDIDTLRKAYAEDHAFNATDTPMRKWDRATGMGLVNQLNGRGGVPTVTGGGVRGLMASRGITLASMAECVCVLKQAAEMAVLRGQTKEGYT